MPVGMTFQDISTVLTEINKLATGQEPTSEIVDTSSFVSVAETLQRTSTVIFARLERAILFAL